MSTEMIINAKAMLKGMKKAALEDKVIELGELLIEANDAKNEAPTPDEERDMELSRLKTKVKDLQDENRSLINAKKLAKNGFPPNLKPNAFNFMFSHDPKETEARKKFKITTAKDKDGKTIKVSTPVPFFSTRGQNAKHIHLDFMHPVTITGVVKIMHNGEEIREEGILSGMARIVKKTTMFAAVGKNEDGSAYAWGNIHHDEPENKVDNILPTPSDPDSAFMEDEDGKQSQEEKDVPMRSQKEADNA